jgi:hypothetical protein
MEEVQAVQETRKLVMVEKLCCREDGGWSVEDGVASDRAELGGLQDR